MAQTREYAAEELGSRKRLTGLLGRIATPQGLLMGLVAVGLLSSQSAPGTLAYFTASATSSTQFVAGSLALNTSSLPATASFGWNTSGPGSNCASISGVAAPAGQPIVPNTRCTGTFTVTNSGNIDANTRLRFIRVSPGGSADTAMNNALKLYLADGGSTGCDNAASWPPSGWTTITNGSTTFDGKVIGTSGYGITTTFSGTPAGFDIVTATNSMELFGNTASGDPGTGWTLAPGTSKTFCMRFELPSGTGNTAQAGDNTYYFVADAIQKTAR